MNHSLSLSALRSMMNPHVLGTSQAYQVAEKQAYKFLKLTGCTQPTQISDAIAGLPRFRIDVVDTLPSSGASEWKDGHWQILIRASEPPVRQRFTLAHELKHVLDHPFVGRSHYSSSLSDEERNHIESVCDYFAGCLLMPRAWLKQAWADGMQDVDQLATAFGVSRQAMTVRLDQTGIRPASAGLSARDSLRRAFQQRPRSRRRYERTGWNVHEPALASLV